jgi:hypothetical protein
MLHPYKVQYILLRLEHILSDPAYRTDPIIRNIIERSTWSDSGVWVADGRVINITAY